MSAGKTQVGVKIDEDNLKILDDLPSSAVEMQVKSKVSNQAVYFLKKLNRQERVVEEVKLVLKPHYNKKHVTKDEYKDILRRAVPKVSTSMLYCLISSACFNLVLDQFMIKRL